MSEAAPALEPQKDTVPDSIFLVSYPKIVYLYPTWIASLVAGIYLLVAKNEITPTTTSIALIFLGMLAVNLVVLAPNAQSALRLGEARGVILQVCGKHEVPVHEIPPATVKRRVAGAGAASKERLAELVRAQFSLPEAEFAAEDESDALAVAACYLMERGAAHVAGAPVPRGAGSKARGLPRGAREQ